MWYVVHPSTPYYSGTPLKNFDTPLGVQYTRLKSTDLKYTHFKPICLICSYKINKVIRQTGRT